VSRFLKKLGNAVLLDEQTLRVSGQPITIRTDKSVVTIDGVADASIRSGTGGVLFGSPFTVQTGGLTLGNGMKARSEIRWGDSIWYWQANGRQTQFVRSDGTVVATQKRRDLLVEAPQGSADWMLAVLTFASGVHHQSRPVGLGGFASGADGIFQVVAFVCLIVAAVAYLLSRF
jgi:hypothetical protein